MKTQIKYSELSAENKIWANNQMYYFNNTRYNWPSSVNWKSEDELSNDILQGYNPDEHFSFYLDENEEVEVKIG